LAAKAAAGWQIIPGFGGVETLRHLVDGCMGDTQAPSRQATWTRDPKMMRK